MYLKRGKDVIFSPALTVTASLCFGGEGVGGSGLRRCLWAKISTGPSMVHSNVIEKIKLLVQKWCLEQGKEDKFSPALTVADSFCYGGGGVVGGGPWLCLWAEISTGLWMVRSNVIEKIKLLVAKMVFRTGKGGRILTCAHGRRFSLLRRRGRWWRRPVVVSVG